MSELGQTSRASNALLKRQEAIKRWMLSDTNRQSLHRPSTKVRITFEKETVFLSAVSSGDVDETKKLIDGGVDINCANVDGLTALHQVRKNILLGLILPASLNSQCAASPNMFSGITISQQLNTLMNESFI